MNWISTRGAAPPVTLRQALFAGPAPDGGLYLPERLEPLPSSLIHGLRGQTLVDTGAAIAAHLIGAEVPRETLKPLLAAALDFPVPLVAIPHPPGTSALELFHGPTFAFKDVGARVMARLMAHFLESGEAPPAQGGAGAPGRALTILVATSGDTGSAVAQAFAGLPAMRVVVLFPEGQVTPVQEAQFTTLGGNICAVAVQGTFDDCQGLVRTAFADDALRRDVRLVSANSMNVGRLLPQIFYYAWASLERSEPSRLAALARGKRPEPPGPCVFSVPSGNFGNLTAGLIAKRLGFPIAHFVAATNVNAVVPEYLASGVYSPRASVRTVANAMDVGAPSNLERVRALYGDEVERLREDVTGIAFEDARIVAAMHDVHERCAYVLDPHSAVAWLGLRARPPRHDGAPGIFLATAHPAKFREHVEPAIGRPIEMPAALRDSLARPRLVTCLAPEPRALARLLTR